MFICSMARMETMALALCLVQIVMDLSVVTVADTVPDKCGDILTDRTGVISNRFHPPDFFCKWIIEAEPGNIVELSFSYVKMAPPDSKCNFGAVTIYDGYRNNNIVLGSICHNTENKFYSTHPIMTIVFSTDSLISGDEFETHYITNAPSTFAK